MRWRQKSLIQKMVDKLLPSKMSYIVYYFLQRKFGALRQVNPCAGLKAGLKLNVIIKNNCCSLVKDKIFLEVGTGRRLNLPISLWLCGASKIYTVDLNPYLKEELVFEDLEYIRNHQQKIKELFKQGEVDDEVFIERFNQLINCPNDLDVLQKLVNIVYLAPQDAAKLSHVGKIDYHISYTVFEHIPPEIIKNILIEGKKIINREGRFIHLIDFSDHFSHTDKNITAINFLQFSQREWNRMAGNRYMYHNRMRVDDYKILFEEVGLCADIVFPHVDQVSLAKLQKGFDVNIQFKHKSFEDLATINAVVIAHQNHNEAC